MCIRVRYTVTIALSDKIPGIQTTGFFNNSVEAIKHGLSLLDKIESLYVDLIEVTTQIVTIEEV